MITSCYNFGDSLFIYGESVYSYDYLHDFYFLADFFVLSKADLGGPMR